MAVIESFVGKRPSKEEQMSNAGWTKKELTQLESMPCALVQRFYFSSSLQLRGRTRFLVVMWWFYLRGDWDLAIKRR
jgi:hypothetical protein